MYDHIQSRKIELMETIDAISGEMYDAATDRLPGLIRKLVEARGRLDEIERFEAAWTTHLHLEATGTHRHLVAAGPR